MDWKLTKEAEESGEDRRRGLPRQWMPRWDWVALKSKKKTANSRGGIPQ